MGGSDAMTECNLCGGARMVPNSGEAALYQSHVPCPGCNAPEPPRWTWERLRDFFAGGGKISEPATEDLMRDVRPERLTYGGDV